MIIILLKMNIRSQTTQLLSILLGSPVPAQKMPLWWMRMLTDGYYRPHWLPGSLILRFFLCIRLALYVLSYGFNSVCSAAEFPEIEFIQLKQNLVLALCMVSYLFNNSIAFLLTAGFHVLLRMLHNADSFKEILT